MKRGLKPVFFQFCDSLSKYFKHLTHEAFQLRSNLIPKKSGIAKSHEAQSNFVKVLEM